MTQDHLWQKFKNFVHLLQAIWANIRYGFPSRKLKIIAVTGSDGKTTTTSMLYHVLNQSGLNVAYMSTIEAKIGDMSLDTGLHVTSPDPWMLPKYLKMMVDEGIEYVVLEATSQGLQQHRLWNVEFDGAIITNIREDHLDYHGTWENYANAKYKVIQKLKTGGRLVLNQDDEKAAEWLQNKLQHEQKNIDLIWISKNDANNLNKKVDGMSFDYKGQQYDTPLIGEYNLENILEVIALSGKYLKPQEIAKTTNNFPVPKGRMETVQIDPFTIIIDFAHTPNALEQALTAVLGVKKDKARLITVFGCAGKRDRSRRKMGAVAARLADVVILTAEDARDEKLADLNNEIIAHAETAGGKLVARMPQHAAYTDSFIGETEKNIADTIKSEQVPVIAFDEDSVASRQDAIDFAIKIAKPNDIVFITGKAHEQSLAFGEDETEYPWSDHEAVQQALAKISNN